MGLDDLLKLILFPAAATAFFLLLLALSWLWDQLDKLLRRWQESWGKDGRDDDRH